MKQYQVVFLERTRQPESIFSGDRGDFYAQDMQDTLNSHAAQGWRVISCTPMHAFYGATEKFVVVLEQA